MTIRGEGVYDYRQADGAAEGAAAAGSRRGPVEHRPITELLAPGALFMKNRGAGVPADKWVRVDTRTRCPTGTSSPAGRPIRSPPPRCCAGRGRRRTWGRTEVAGTAVRHYRGTADLGGAAHAGLRREQEALSGGGERVRHRRGAVRRLPRRRGAHPQGPAPVQLRQRAAGGPVAVASTTLLYDFGASVRVRLPDERGHLRGQDRGASEGGAADGGRRTSPSVPCAVCRPLPTLGSR